MSQNSSNNTSSSQSSSNSPTLCLTQSNSSSLSSYNSSIAESTATKTSIISTKVKQILHRRRSQSLNFVDHITLTDSNSSNSTTTSTKNKLLRNKSISSIFSTSLIMSSDSNSPNPSTRDNSISSLSDMELDFTLQPLTKIEENGKTSSNDLQKPLRKLSIVQSPINETEIKMYDEIANNILDKISKVEDTVDWRI